MMITVDNFKHDLVPLRDGFNRVKCSWRVVVAIAGIVGLTEPAVFAVPVAARVASVKGSVTASSEAVGTEPLKSGMVVRSGTVISAAAQSGALIRPAPKVGLVIFMATKVRFDGASLDAQGQGSVQCSVLGGRIMVIIDPEAQLSEGPGKVKISLATQEGIIAGSKGTWSVQQEEGRTMVAVSQGVADVSIGGGTAVGNGQTGSQVEVPEGSVMWLDRRADGMVEAKIVNTETGAMVVIMPDGTRDTSQKAPPALLAEARGVLDGSGDSTASDLLIPSTDGNNTPTTPNNPDFSTPKPEKPVVSQDTP